MRRVDWYVCKNLTCFYVSSYSYIHTCLLKYGRERCAKTNRSRVLTWTTPATVFQKPPSGRCVGGHKPPFSQRLFKGFSNVSQANFLNKLITWFIIPPPRNNDTKIRRIFGVTCMRCRSRLLGYNTQSTYIPFFVKYATLHNIVAIMSHTSHRPPTHSFAEGNSCDEKIIISRPGLGWLAGDLFFLLVSSSAAGFSLAAR